MKISNQRKLCFCKWKGIKSTLFLFCILFLILVPSVHAETRILFLGWNVESGGNDPFSIAKTLSEFEGYDIVGLCEVKSSNADLYANAVEVGEGAKGSDNQDFRYRLGTTGGADRLMIIWDAKRFDLVGDAVELTNLNQGNHRAPLVVQLKLKGTNNQLLFMVNHLARGNATLRQSQATGLGKWAANQTLPIIAVGDYNFDYNIDDGKGNPAFDNMLANGAFEWVKPPELYKTSLSAKYNGVLDFVFTANIPDKWEVNSRIIVEGFSFPDNDHDSDHRPVRGRLKITKE